MFVVKNKSRFHLSKIFGLLLGFICWSFLLTLLFLPLTFLLVSKCVVILAARIFRKDLSSVSTGDAAFTIGCTYEKSKGQLSVGLLSHVQGQLKLDQVQNHFSTKLLQRLENDKPKYDKLFSCLVTFGGYVFRKSLPPSGIELEKLIYEGKLEDGETLEIFIEKWMAKSYSEMSPAWEVVVIPMENTTVIAFKIHHAFSDGYSMLHILDVLTGSKAPYLVKEANETIWKKISDVILMPLNLRILCGPGSPTTNPIKLSAPQKKWIYTFTTLPIQPIKAIRQKYDVHFATIILTLIVGSIRQYLLESRGEEELPSHFPMADTLPCELHPSQDHILCNHWTLGIIKSPLKEDNPLQRLIETEKFFIDFHELGLHKVAVNYLFPFAWLFPKFIVEKVLKEDRVPINCGLTSLVGANDYKFLGGEVQKISPLLSLVDTHPFTAFTWFTFSHGGKVDVTLSAAPDLFPSRDAFTKMASGYLHYEFKKLCTQCGIPFES